MSKNYEVIGEGAYGCIIKPSLKCKDKRISYKNKVSKIAVSKETQSELDEYNFISDIDKQKKYHLGKPTRCKIKKTKKALKAISKCSRLKEKYLKNKSLKKEFSRFEQLIMEYGGISLTKYIKELQLLPISKKNRSLVRKLWFKMKNLFDGILLFQKNDILHFDIKNQNIVYNLKKKVVKFIDFGHMSHISNIMKKGRESDYWLFDSAHWNYPLEIQYLNKKEYDKYALLSNEQKKALFSNIVSNAFNNNGDETTDAIRTFLTVITMGREHDFQNIQNIQNMYLDGFYNFLMNTLKPGNYEYVLKKSSYSIDVFSLGMSCMELLNATKHLIQDNIVRELESCFFHMFNPDLEYRYTIQEANEHFLKILELWNP